MKGRMLLINIPLGRYKFPTRFHRWLFIRLQSRTQRVGPLTTPESEVIYASDEVEGD